MASVKKRKDSPYFVLCYRLPDGSRKQRSSRVVDRSVALALAEKLELPYRQRTSQLTVKKLLADVEVADLDFQYQVFESNRPLRVLRVRPPQPVSGVYFLFCDNECVYVGQSINAHARIMQHRAERMFDHADILPVPNDQLLKTERYYIGLLKPKWNIALNGISAKS